MSRIRAGFLLAVVMTSAVCLTARAGQDYYWDDTDGQWDVATNWDPSGVPTSGDDAYIDNSGTAQVDGNAMVEAQSVYIGNNSNGAVVVTGLNSKLNAVTLFSIGYNNTGEGSVELANGGQATSETFEVGRYGTGILNIASGGKATATSDFYIGRGPSGDGAVTIEDSGSGIETLNGVIAVGYDGTGKLILTDGGTATASKNISIGTTAGSTGTVMVGADSTLTSTTGNVNVGGSAGAVGGTGLLAGTGTVSASAGAGTVQVWSTGTLSPGDADGAGGTLNITGSLNLRDASTLKIDINDTDNDTIAVSGAVTVGASEKITVTSTRTGTFEIITAGSAISDTNLGSAIITGTVDGYSLAVRGGANSLQVKSTDDRVLELTLGALQNKTLYWTDGAATGVWSTSVDDLNWTDNPGGGATETRFMTGDSVVFGNNATNKTVNVASAIEVGTMSVTDGGYTFTVDLDAGGSITATTQFTNAGNAEIVATKNSANGLSRSQANATLFTVLDGAGADAFSTLATFDTTNSRIRSELFSDGGTLGFLLWLVNRNLVDDMNGLLNPGDITGNLSVGGNYTNAVMDALPPSVQDKVNEYVDIIYDRGFSSDAARTAFKQLYGESAAYALDGHRLGRRRFTSLIANWLDVRSVSRRIESAIVSRTPFAASSALASRAALSDCGGLANRIWGGGFGVWDKQDSRDGIAGYDFDGGGVILGYDHALFDNFVLGFAGSYTRGKTKVKDLRTEYDADLLNLGLYGEYAHDSGFFTRFGLGFGYGWNDYDANLLVDGTKHGKYHSQSYSANLELGYQWALPCNVNLTPSVGIDYTWLRNGSWRESATGAGVANFYKSGHENIVDIPLAVRLDKVFDLGGGCYVAPEVRIAYVVAAGDKRPSINGGDVGGPSGLIQKGVNVGASRAQFGAGLKARFSDRIEGRLDYQFEVRNKYRGHTLSASLGVAF